MDDHELWELTQEAWAALNPYLQPIIERLSAESGVDHAAWGLLLAARTFEPETTTPARLQVRGPYTAAEGYRTRPAAAVDKGYLTEVATG